MIDALTYLALVLLAVVWLCTPTGGPR